MDQIKSNKIYELYNKNFFFRNAMDCIDDVKEFLKINMGHHLCLMGKEILFVSFNDGLDKIQRKDL